MNWVITGKNGVNLGANLYYMDYHNQMVQTGKLNDVGYKLMENVKTAIVRVLSLRLLFLLE